MSTTIWHNPRCSKSRQTLQLLRDNGVEPTIRLYLDDPPGPDEIREALGKLGLTAGQLVRKKEAPYAELGLKNADDEAVIRAMSEHPKLIERPVVFHGDKAALGRPPEQVLSLF